MDLNQKRMVVTGASSGIGRALLQELSRRSVQVIAVGRDETRLQQAIRSVPASRARFITFPCDVALQRGVDNLFAFGVQQMGGIDIFFANAGFAYWEQLPAPDWGRTEAIFQTNVFSPIYSVAKMEALFPGEDYRVVITSSILGRVGLQGYALYAATKAALDRFAEVYRLGHTRRGQLVLVYPLAVRSCFFQAAGGAPLPLPLLIQSPEEVARAMLRGLGKDRETIYTSWILRPMLLVSHLLPFTRHWYQALDARASRARWEGRSSRHKVGDP
jgi:short-subunit dehydrogenase